MTKFSTSINETKDLLNIIRWTIVYCFRHYPAKGLGDDPFCSCGRGHGSHKDGCPHRDPRDHHEWGCTCGREEDNHDGECEIVLFLQWMTDYLIEKVRIENYD